MGHHVAEGKPKGFSFTLPESAPITPTSWRQSLMPFEVFMHTWDEISGRKVLATVPTMQEADEKLDEMSERFPHAYIDYRGVPE
jgi:hypothetical protein|tara:strand:- start:504 stop:755 length:252 start_codon:yes stop_codon:yes gene_type:complete